MLSIILIAVTFFISGCNSEFFQPPFDDLLTKKPVDTSPGPILPPPDPISEPIRELPYHQTDFDFQNEGEGLVVSKVIDSAGNQKTPIIYKNKIAYVTSNHPGTGKDEIYMYDFEKKTNTRLTWRLDGRSQWISTVRTGEDIVVWIEHANTAYYHDIYIKHLNTNLPEEKIHSFKIEGGPDDGYLPSLKIFKNYIYWAEQKETYKNSQIFFYDLITKKKHEMIGLQSRYFQVENNWIVFWTDEQTKPKIQAYNLMTAEKFNLSSQDAQPSTNFVIRNNKVLWKDFRFTKNSIYTYDLEKKDKGSEQLLLILDAGSSGDNIVAFENNLLYLSWAYDVYVYDLISFKVYHFRCRNGNDVSKNVSVDGDQFTLSYNDTLIRDNDDIFHIRVTR